MMVVWVKALNSFSFAVAHAKVWSFLHLVKVNQEVNQVIGKSQAWIHHVQKRSALSGTY